MSEEPTGPVTKQEALLMLNKHFTENFVDVNTLCQMFRWQARLSALVLQEFAENHTTAEIKQLEDKLSIDKLKETIFWPNKSKVKQHDPSQSSA